MKYIKTFKNHSDYQDFINKGGDGNPNTSIHYIIDSDLGILKDYNGHGKQKAGDVAYWNGSCVKTMDYNKYTSAFGPAVGVVVIPEGFAPDGKTRIVALNVITDVIWHDKYENILAEKTFMPTTDNLGSTTTGSNQYGYLPTDVGSGEQSYVDPIAKYEGNTPMVPSPYLGENPNPEYYKTLEGGNVLADFNGFNNTRMLVDLGTSYQAANACWNYKDGSSNLQWYMPSLGEAGYLGVRIGAINHTSKVVLNGIDFFQKENCLTSSCVSETYAFCLRIWGYIFGHEDKKSLACVYPFAII